MVLHPLPCLASSLPSTDRLTALRIFFFFLLHFREIPNPQKLGATSGMNYAKFLVTPILCLSLFCLGLALVLIVARRKGKGRGKGFVVFVIAEAVFLSYTVVMGYDYSWSGQSWNATFGVFSGWIMVLVFYVLPPYISL